MDSQVVLLSGIGLVLLGFLLVFLSGFLPGGLKPGDAKAEAGGVLLIGPIPIVFGSSPGAALVAAASALALLAAVFLLFFFKRG